MTTINDLNEALDLLADERIGMLTTIDERGTLSSRPMTVQRTDAVGDVWFVADRDADWVAPAHGAAANLAVATGDRWLSFAGRLDLITNTHTLADFADAETAEHTDSDPASAVLRLVVDRVEWWASANLLERMIEVTRAGLAGEDADLGASGVIEVDPTVPAGDAAPAATDHGEVIDTPMPPPLSDSPFGATSDTDDVAEENLVVGVRP